MSSCRKWNWYTTLCWSYKEKYGIFIIAINNGLVAMETAKTLCCPQKFSIHHLVPWPPGYYLSIGTTFGLLSKCHYVFFKFGGLAPLLMFRVQTLQPKIFIDYWIFWAPNSTQLPFAKHEHKPNYKVVQRWRGGGWRGILTNVWLCCNKDTWRSVLHSCEMEGGPNLSQFPLGLGQ